MKGKIGYLVPQWPGSWDPEDENELAFRTESEFNHKYYERDKVKRIVYFEVEYD